MPKEYILIFDPKDGSRRKIVTMWDYNKRMVRVTEDQLTPKYDIGPYVTHVGRTATLKDNNP